MSASRDTRPAMTPAPGPALRDFEAGTIDMAAFDHRAHVYVAWCYLERYGAAEAILRFTGALRRLTERLGFASRYHETICWFFMLVIAERRLEARTGGWDAFERHNGDLCRNAGTLLRRHYSGERLNSATARRLFLLPDRTAG